jgi:hypothetical protein
MAAAVVLLAAPAAFREYKSSEIRKGYGLVAVSAAVGLFVVGSLLLVNVTARLSVSVFANRNFYGAFTVMAQNTKEPAWRSYVLRHGRIRHGMQFLAPDKRHRPTTYYGPSSSIRGAWPRRPVIGRFALGSLVLGPALSPHTAKREITSVFTK